MSNPLGRYRCLKLPFGIKLAPKMYTITIDETLDEKVYTYTFMDDVLVAEEKAKMRYSSVQKAATLSLNLTKKVQKQEVPYVYHIS